MAVAPSMLNKAQETLRTIRPALKRKFTNRVTSHFEPPNGRKNNRYGPRRDEFDPDVEDFLIASTISDKYSQVLIEGMDFLNKKKQKSFRQIPMPGLQRIQC